MPFYIYLIWVSNVSFSSSRTPKHLLEGTRKTKLLSMEITSDKSPDLVFKLYLDPTTINLVLRGWNWSLISTLADFKLSSHCDFLEIYQGTFVCVTISLKMCSASKWCSVSGFDCIYLNPLIKMTLIELQGTFKCVNGLVSRHGISRATMSVKNV